MVKIRKKILGILITLIPLHCAPLSWAVENQQFMLFDEIRLKNKPNLTKYGLKKLHLVPAAAMWPKGATLDEPNPEYVKRYIKWEYPKKDIICLNIEHWPVTLNRMDKTTVDRNIEKLLSVFRAAKSVRPNDLIGYYGIIPIRDYHAPVKNIQHEMVKWQDANRYLNRIAKEMDVIFPSLYTFYKDQNGWKKYAKVNLQEARRYGKPVYAFIWPQYHGSNKKLGGKFVGKEYWKVQLETVYQYADGVVIWTPWTNRGYWDENAGWWIATKEFVSEKKLNK